MDCLQQGYAKRLGQLPGIQLTYRWTGSAARVIDSRVGTESRLAPQPWSGVISVAMFTGANNRAAAQRYGIEWSV
ncbi:hypothetical protein GCM10028821_29030 [Hymenobacter jeollabukensis]